MNLVGMGVLRLTQSCSQTTTNTPADGWTQGFSSQQRDQQYHHHQKQQPVILHAGMSRGERALLQRAVDTLGGLVLDEPPARVEPDVVTHVVVGQAALDPYGRLQAEYRSILDEVKTLTIHRRGGCWVVQALWAEAALEQGRWIHEQQYGIYR